MEGVNTALSPSFPFHYSWPAPTGGATAYLFLTSRPARFVIRQESADTYSVLETMATARGARTMELDPRTHHVFLATAEFGPAPAPTPEQPRPRPALVPGTFMVLEFGK